MIQNLNIIPIFELLFIFNSLDANTETKLQRGQTGASLAVIFKHRLDMDSSDLLLLFHSNKSIMLSKNDEGFLKKSPYKRSQPVPKDPFRKCLICDKDYVAVSVLQKTCSVECRRVKDNMSRKKFHAKYGNTKHKVYNATRMFCTGL